VNLIEPTPRNLIKKKNNVLDKIIDLDWLGDIQNDPII
jgi:hypothetical protein